MFIKLGVEAKIDVEQNIQKVQDPAFWTYAASEWHRLYGPYVPMQTGNLKNTVVIRPGEIEHTVPYARYQYEGHFKHNRDLNPKASRKWDKAAAPTQKPKLISTMQGYINSGRLKLD